MSNLELITPLSTTDTMHEAMDSDLPELNPGKLLTGDNIRRARIAKGWTKTELAKRCGVSERAVYNWEHGVHTPEGDARDCLMRELDLDIPEDMGRGRASKATDENRQELEMIRSHVKMIGMLLDQMLDAKS